MVEPYDNSQSNCEKVNDNTHVYYDVKAEYEKANQYEKQIRENKGCVFIEKLGEHCCGKEKISCKQFCEKHSAESYFLDLLQSGKKF